MKIYTLTLNPAYDIHAFTEQFKPYHENLAQVQSRDAGGKGVNISRALNNYGIANTAVIVLGRENSGAFKQDLANANIQSILFEKDGHIRENLTLHCDSAPETRISFAGFSVDDSILNEIAEAIQVDEETILTFTGRVPSGMSINKVKEFLKQLKAKGAKIVLDSKSFGLTDIYELQPWLIKPNQEELSEYFECDVRDLNDALEKAREFAKQGVINVMVSLGNQGALLLADGQIYKTKPPVIDIVSTIGAGDSSIAGFITATLLGENSKECLNMAVAFGTAACLSEGTKPPKKEEVNNIYEQIKNRVES